jgi:hypothetical protein
MRGRRPDAESPPQRRQISAKAAARREAAEAKVAEGAAAAAAAAAEARRAKEAARAAKAALFAAQAQAVAASKQARLLELNGPPPPGDRWVHAAVIEGRARGFQLRRRCGAGLLVGSLARLLAGAERERGPLVHCTAMAMPPAGALQTGYRARARQVIGLPLDGAGPHPAAARRLCCVAPAGLHVRVRQQGGQQRRTATGAPAGAPCKEWGQNGRRRAAPQRGRSAEAACRARGAVSSGAARYLIAPARSTSTMLNTFFVESFL